MISERAPCERKFEREGRERNQSQGDVRQGAMRSGLGPARRFRRPQMSSAVHDLRCGRHVPPPSPFKIGPNKLQFSPMNCIICISSIGA